MPTLDLDQNLLSASAGFQASDWAEGDAAATLDFRAGAALDRGIDLELGIGVMALLDASFHKFLAIDGQARAEASAGLRGQIQLPMDVFSEAGIAVRLEAAAQAAAMVKLGIGLSVRDFIALARQDPRIDGIAEKLLIILLEEVKIEAGAHGKVAFSAMAYANLALTVRFIEDRQAGLKPGVTIGGGYGVGLEAGYGWGVYAELGLLDARRYIRRTVDALVEEVYRNIEPRLPDEAARTAIAYMRYPAKMALRASFEIGMALADASPTFAGDGQALAKQCLHVVLEEAQRALLEELAKLSLKLFRRALDEAGVSDSAWQLAEAQREAFATQLDALPDEPFELTPANALYWSSLVSAGIDVGLALADNQVNRAKWQEPLANVWAASHLAMIAVQRTTDASARASALGAYTASSHIEPFAGGLPPDMAPPPVVRDHIRSAVGGTGSAALTQDDLIEFLLRDANLTTLLREVTEVRDLLDIIAGPTGDAPLAAAKTIFHNLGAFVPTTGGAFDAQASLGVIVQGLRSYLDVRLKQELAPLLYAATEEDPTSRIYIDEVLIPSMDFAVGVAFQKVLEWGFGELGKRDALREACSSIVMKLMGRSLVVTSDVLTTYAMSEMSETVSELADHVNDSGGIAQTLAELVSVDRMTIAEILEETLTICSEVLTPLPPDKRATIRALLYELIDTTPADPYADWLEQLAQDFAFPSPESQALMLQLADELGTQTTDYLGRFFNRVLARIAQLVAEEIAELVEDIVTGVEEWLDDMKQLARELSSLLMDLPRRIDALVDEANALLAGALATLADLVGTLRSGSMREDVHVGAVSLLVSQATGALAAIPGWDLLTAGQRDLVRSGLRTAAESAVDIVLVDTLLAGIEIVGPQLEALLTETVETLDELRAVEPSADAGAEVLAILRRHIEDAAFTAMGGSNPSIDLDFTVHWTVPVPPVWGVVEWNDYGIPVAWGWIEQPPLSVDFRCDIGRIELPLEGLIGLCATAFAGLDGLAALADDLAGQLAEFFAAEDTAHALEAEFAMAEIQYPLVTKTLDAAAARDLGVEILAPLSGSLHKSDVDVDLALTGVPASFFGKGEFELQRVHLWLNESPLDLAEAYVEATGHPASEDGTPRVDRGRRTSEAHQSDLPSALTRTLTGTQATRKFSTVDERQAKGSEERRPKLRSLTGTRATDPKKQAESPAAQGYDPTRNLTGKEREEACERLGYALRIRLRLTSELLIDGANTLSVAVVGSASERVVQTVVFLSGAEAVVEPPLRGSDAPRKPVPLPGKIFWDPAEIAGEVRAAANRDPRIPLLPADSTRRPRSGKRGSALRDHPLSILARSKREAARRESRATIGRQITESRERLATERMRRGRNLKKVARAAPKTFSSAPVYPPREDLK